MKDIKGKEDYDPDPENHRQLEDPIKVQWQSTKLRSRIKERLWDYSNWDREGEGWEEWSLDLEDNGRPAVAYRTLNRQKTNVIIKTVEEATALHNVLDWYSTGGGPRGITWMNMAMENSARRVRKEIREGLEERGYNVKFSETSKGKIYVEG